MNMEVLDDADSAAQRAVAIIAEDAREAVSERGRFVMAVRGRPDTVADVARAYIRADPVAGP
jgi:hypothetical protein